MTTETSTTTFRMKILCRHQNTQRWHEDRTGSKSQQKQCCVASKSPVTLCGISSLYLRSRYDIRRRLQVRPLAVAPVLSCVVLAYHRPSSKYRIGYGRRDKATWVGEWTVAACGIQRRRRANSEDVDEKVRRRLRSSVGPGRPPLPTFHMTPGLQQFVRYDTGQSKRQSTIV